MTAHLAARKAIAKANKAKETIETKIARLVALDEKLVAQAMAKGIDVPAP